MKWPFNQKKKKECLLPLVMKNVELKHFQENALYESSIWGFSVFSVKKVILTLYIVTVNPSVDLKLNFRCHKEQIHYQQLEHMVATSWRTFSLVRAGLLAVTIAWHYSSIRLDLRWFMVLYIAVNLKLVILLFNWEMHFWKSQVVIFVNVSQRHHCKKSMLVCEGIRGSWSRATGIVLVC